MREDRFLIVDDSCCISSTKPGRTVHCDRVLSWITAAAKFRADARITKSSSSRIQTSLGIPKKPMPFPIRNGRSVHCDRAEGGDDCYRSRIVCILEKAFCWLASAGRFYAFVFVEELPHTATGKLKTKRREDFGNWGCGNRSKRK